MSDYSEDSLAQAAKEAVVLQKAAVILKSFADGQQRMVEDGDMPEDETAEDMHDAFTTGAEACEKLSMSMVIVLAQHGVEPDFSILDFDEEEEDSGPAFY